MNNIHLLTTTTTTSNFNCIRTLTPPNEHSIYPQTSSVTSSKFPVQLQHTLAELIHPSSKSLSALGLPRAGRPRKCTGRCDGVVKNTVGPRKRTLITPVEVQRGRQMDQHSPVERARGASARDPRTTGTRAPFHCVRRLPLRAQVSSSGPAQRSATSGQCALISSCRASVFPFSSSFRPASSSRPRVLPARR